jgi:hypothetical protein
MRRSLPIFALVSCLIISGCSQKREVFWTPGEDHLPKDWDPKDLGLATQAGLELDKGKVAAESHILIWQTMEDKGTHRRVDLAIIWIRLENGGHGRWILAYVYRWPRQPQEHGEWGLAVEFDLEPPQEVWREFDHAPNNNDIRGFLRDAHWVFGPHSTMRVPDSALCAGTWKAVTGQEPMKFYEGPVR